MSGYFLDPTRYCGGFRVMTDFSTPSHGYPLMPGSRVGVDFKRGVTEVGTLKQMAWDSGTDQIYFEVHFDSGIVEWVEAERVRPLIE